LTHDIHVRRRHAVGVDIDLLTLDADNMEVAWVFSKACKERMNELVLYVV